MSDSVKVSSYVAISDLDFRSTPDPILSILPYDNNGNDYNDDNNDDNDDNTLQIGYVVIRPDPQGVHRCCTFLPVPWGLGRNDDANDNKDHNDNDDNNDNNNDNGNNDNDNNDNNDNKDDSNKGYFFCCPAGHVFFQVRFLGIPSFMAMIPGGACPP